MRRYIAPIVIFSIGIVLLILGAARILPQFTGAGGSLVLLGIVLFALSFIPKPSQKDNDAPQTTEIERLTKIFYAPAEAFQSLRRNPRWLAPLLIITIFSAAYLYAFTDRVTPERIGNYTTDKLAQSGFVPADKINELREQQVEQLKNPLYRAGNVVNAFVFAFVSCAVLAAIYFALLLAFGAEINFWQAFSAVIYTFVPATIIQKVASTIILFLKDPTDINPIVGQQTLLQDHLGAFLSPSNGLILFVIASSIGIVALYTLWLTATGLRNAGEKVSATAAWSATLTVWVVTLLAGIVLASAFPSFLS